MNKQAVTQETFAVGDQPGTGHYRCCNCDKYVVSLLSPKDQIPPCDNCGTGPAVRYRVDDREAAESHGP